MVVIGTVVSNRLGARGNIEGFGQGRLARREPAGRNAMAAITGGCLCGAIRYEADEPPVDTGYCHCRMCQRASGSPVQAFASFPIGLVPLHRRRAAVFVSSAIGERRFCGRCGSSLEFRERLGPQIVSSTAGTLDDPSLAPPPSTSGR